VVCGVARLLKAYGPPLRRTILLGDSVLPNPSATRAGLYAYSRVLATGIFAVTGAALRRARPLLPRALPEANFRGIGSQLSAGRSAEI